jgi:hypothetical protein
MSGEFSARALNFSSAGLREAVRILSKDILLASALRAAVMMAMRK